ncbi:MAG: ABC transporter ATP-binding protein [Thermoplasmata archaeon]
MNIIEISGLDKSYGDITALDGLDLSVRKGEIYGFLGPNGAGKTTTIKAIMGLIKPDRGDITVNGMDVRKEGIEIRKSLGYLPETLSFYDRLTIEENLRFFSKIKGASSDDVVDMLTDFGLADRVNSKVGTLSKGMVQRLGLIQTLIGDPPILILDEPTSGLDPEIRRWVKDKILELKRMNKTIFLSSHVLAEVQQMCDRVGIISRGRAIREDEVEALQEELRLNPRLTLLLPHGESIDDAVVELDELDFVYRPRKEGGKLVLYCDERKKIDVIKYLLDAGYDIEDFDVEEPDLEEMFVKIMEGDK